MVRETRHLWVGNLPDNIREEDIVEHFKRYGRVQSVKFVSRGVEGGGGCATVSFMDIKSASKAHSVDQKLEECALTTEYHEPAAIPRDRDSVPLALAPPSTPLPLPLPGGAGGGGRSPLQYASPRFNHGSSEEGAFDRSSHFYGEGEAYARRPSSTYHPSSTSSSDTLRGRPRDRLYRNGPYPTIESVVARPAGTTTGSHHRGTWNYEGTGRYTPPDHPSLISPRRDNTTTVVSITNHRSKKHSKSRSGSNGSESGGSNSISSSRSRSRSNSSSSRSSSASSPHSSPSSSKTCSTHRSRSTLQSAVSTSSPGLHSEDRRALAICVRNVPVRSSDTSLKDGLYHEYKKHGKVAWVKILGQGVDRYGLVCFKKPEDAEKALQGSHEKLFFGTKIEVAPYHDVDLDFEFRPYEAELDEYHPKATRTLFIGNLEKDITASELQKHFDQFGQIIFVDMKKQSSSSAYAFVQYTDISSVVRAMRAMDGEYVGNNRVNLGYGKSLATTCVWVDGIADNVSDKYLSAQFSQFGPVTHVEIDRSRGQALVFYQQVVCAQLAVNGMRGVVMRSRKLQVDFASRECQDAFYESQKSSGLFENSMGASPASSTSGTGGAGLPLAGVRGGLDTPSSSSSTSSSGRTSYRHSSCRPSPLPLSSSYSPPASKPRSSHHHHHRSSCDYTSEFVMDRRPPYRSFEDTVIEEKMVVVIQQAPSEMRHQKERMSLDEMSSVEETQEHRRKCKHRRSHSGENSRPGTPLCDERPDYPNNKHETSFPLFSNSLMSLKPPPSPPPSPSPPPRPPSSSSEDSEPSTSPQLTDWELRLKSLDEKYEKWSGCRTVTANTKVTEPGGQKVRHKLLDLNVHELQPSDIVKSVLAKRSVFDEDSKRLENMNEKYEPKEYIPSRIGLQNFRSYLTPPKPMVPTPPPPVVSKGLQYPFPSHPHIVNNSQPSPQPQPQLPNNRRDVVTVNHAVIETSKPIVPMPNNIRRNSTNSTLLGDTARRRSREETVHTSQLLETKNVNETRINLESKPLAETSTNTTSDNKDVKAIPSPIEVIKTDIKPPVVKEEISPLVGNNCTATSPVDIKPSIESLTQSKLVPVIKHELPNATEVKIEVNSNPPTLVERRKSTSIEEHKQKNNKELVESKTTLCSDKNESNNKIMNHVSTVLSPYVAPKLKDCDFTHVIEDTKSNNKERDIERDRRKSKEIVENHVSSTSIVPSKSKPSESTEKVYIKDVKDRKEMKHNCVDVHSKQKDRRDSEKDKRKEKENVEVKYYSQRKEHDNPKSQVNDRRSSKEDNEEKEKKRNNEYVSSKQHKTRESESEYSTSRHHNNFARKDKHKSSSSSRHKESEKKTHDYEENKRKDSHEDNKRKDNHEENRRKDNHEDLRKKDSPDESKRKDSNEESKRKDSHDESIGKEIHEELKRKDDHDESKRKDGHEESKRKDSHEESKRKESHEEIKKKDSHDESKRKENHEELKKKDNHDESKRKDSHDESKRKDSHEESKRKDNHEENRRKDGLEEQKRKDSHDESKRKDTLEDLKQKDGHEELKRKDSNDECKRKDEELKRKDSHEELKRKESHEELKRKDSHDENKRKDCHEELKRKEIHQDEHRKKELNDDKKKEVKVVEETKNRDHGESKKKDLEEKRKENCDEKRREFFEDKRIAFEDHKKKEHEDRHSRETQDKESHLYSQRHNFHCKDKDEAKHDHNGHKKKDSEDSSRLKRKDSDHQCDTSKRKEEDKKKENIDKERRRERHSFDSSEGAGKKESDVTEKKKEFDMFKVERKRSYDNSERNKKEDNASIHKKESSSLIENISDAEESTDKRSHIKKEQKKDKISHNSWPATVGCKRRLSSQDSMDNTLDDIKRMKPERRDSKDSKDSNKSTTSTSSSGSSQKKHNDNKDKHQKNVAKMLEEKIKEDKEKESNTKPKKEEKESDDNDSPKARKEKKNSEAKLGETNKLSECENSEKKRRNRILRENGLTCSESETGSCDDGNKKHSIFDIVDDTPAYISMYDKVKARSCKNMQKHEEEKKQEKLKEKFTQLKQSRAKREDKKRSTSYDEDTDSERGIGRRNSKHLITSSEDDITSEYENKSKSKKTIMSDTSDDDILKNAKCKLKAKSRPLRSEESELDTTQDSLLSCIKSEHKLEESDTTKTHIVEESVKQCKSEEKSDKEDIVLNNKISADTDSETHSKKKSHRKKEKRQKSLDSSLSCSDVNKKEKHKKERRKSHNHDSDASGKHVKSRKKKNSRSSGGGKKDVKLETSLFEPLSDDSVTHNVKDNTSNNENKWQVGKVFSDSDSDNDIVRIQEKKRRERKSRELDEAGKALEAKLLDETDHFDATSMLVEKVKKKKKKKKKHHNHHKQRNIEHEEGDGDDEDEEVRSTENELTPPITSQCLSSLLESPPLSVVASKKPDIAGFGLPMDENVHDSAVKSISECENLPAEKKIPEPEPTPVEEKPTIIISQEETEDAVAALLEDAFGGDFDDYTPEENKPGSPDNVSEPDLQIDTDTEDTFDTLDFSKPPRTPDYPSHFDNNSVKDKKPAGFILPKTPDNKAVELPKKSNSELKTESEADEEQASVKQEMKLPPLRPFDTFKSEEKLVTTMESTVYVPMEPINKTSKTVSSVLFTEQSLMKHNKTTELLSHPSWTDKPMAKPITSLEQSIHKTVNLMDQYMNKPPKNTVDTIIKSKHQESVLFKPISNLMHPFDRITSTEQIFATKPVVLSEQYKNIQNPDLVKNCIVSSELMHHKAILSVCKPPMSDVKSVITINKSIVSHSQPDTLKNLIHANISKPTCVETSVVQSHHSPLITTEATQTKPKENAVTPKENNFSHLIQAIDKTILKEPKPEKQPPTVINSFHLKSEDHASCPVTIKEEDLIAKQKLEKLYSNIQPDRYQFGNKTLTITDHNYVVNSFEPENSQPQTPHKAPVVEKVEESKQEPKIVKFVEELEQKLNLEKSQQNLRKALVEESRKQHLDMLDEEMKLKKEDPAVPIIAPLTPKMEEKSAIFVSPGESSCEPKDLESAQTRKELTGEIKDKSDEDSSGRRGRRRKNNNNVPLSSMGGVLTRRTRFSNSVVSGPGLATAAPSEPKVTPPPSSDEASIQKSSDDVYEFKDESDEEETDRPRPLLSSIKSPHHDSKVTPDIKGSQDKSLHHDSKVTLDLKGSQDKSPHHDSKVTLDLKGSQDKSPHHDSKVTHDIKGSQDKSPHHDSKVTHDIKGSQDKSPHHDSNVTPDLKGSQDKSPHHDSKPTPDIKSTHESKAMTEIKSPAVDSKCPLEIKTQQDSSIKMSPDANSLCVLKLTPEQKSPHKLKSPDDVKIPHDPVSVANDLKSTQEAKVSPQEPKVSQQDVKTPLEVKISPHDPAKLSQDVLKSPHEVKTSVDTKSQDTVAIATNLAVPSSPCSASTRKSRRLQEKDVTRNTVDDTIDEVIRTARTSAVTNTPTGRRTTRSQLTASLPGSSAEVTRKSPRRKPAVSTPTASHSTATPVRELSTPVASVSLSVSTPIRSKDTSPVSSRSGNKENNEFPMAVLNKLSETGTCTSPSKEASAADTPTISSSSSVVSVSNIPTTSSSCCSVITATSVISSTGAVDDTSMLIDPVSGELIPVREAEEGQYIPVQADGTRAPQESEEPSEKRLKVTGDKHTLTPDAAASLLKPPIPVPLSVATPTILTLPPKLALTKVSLAKPLNVNVPTTPAMSPQPGVATPSPSHNLSTVLAPGLAVIPHSSVAKITLPQAKFTTIALPVQHQQNLATHPPQAAGTRFAQPQPLITQPSVTKFTTVSLPFQPQPTIAKFITSTLPQHSLAKLTPMSSTVASPVLSQASIVKIPVTTPQPIPINPKAILLSRTQQKPLTPKAHILQSIANGPTSLDPPVPLKAGGTLSPGLLPNPRPMPMDIDPPRPLPYESPALGEVIPSFQHPPASHFVHPTQLYHHYMREAALAQQGGYHVPGPAGQGQGVKPKEGVVAEVVKSPRPHEVRSTDSPTVATLYAHGHGSGHLLFYETPPPGFRPPPPHSSPPEATPPHLLSTDTLYSVLERRYPVMWQGELVLKCDQAFVQMHYVFGNHHLARDALPLGVEEATPTLRIAQRMRLEQTQIDGVVRKMQTDGEHCMLLALPCGRTEVDVVQQSAHLQSGFITYLQQKQAAGIVNIAAPGSQQAAYIVHVFPSCEFANNSLASIDAQLLKKVSELTYLVIIIATTANSATV